jgi:chromosome segregation ATPase
MSEVNHYIVDCNVLRKNDRVRSEVDVMVFLEAEYGAKCHSADVYFDSWKRTEEERDTALAELAALREELASAKADKEAYAQNAIDLRKRMTAAEQRNATLTKALVDTREVLGREYWDQYAGLDETRDILDAALKPTESGTSE